MSDSRPSSPTEAPVQDLWSSILDSVSSSRSIPAKQIVLLGQPSSGKSTLASALLHKPTTDEVKEDERLDYALGYDWADVRDDADEDTLARLSVYTVPSSAASYTSLLPHFLPPRNLLPHTLVIIVLDWTKPWTFLDELHTWLCWIEKWAKGDGSREVEIAREENRERLQAYLQHYTEPSSEQIASALSNATILPLGPGTLTHNSAGVPIIVACTKSDQIDEGNDVIGAGASGMGGMVKGKGGQWEERTDSIMQILRTVCLKYGAGLFYTTPIPQTLQVLRQYALHQLFMLPAPSPAMSTSDTAAPVRNPFPFEHKPNTLDRDRIVVPAGWDSWGKIAVLREGFDAKAWGEAWEHDIDHVEGEPNEEHGAKKLYSALVPDQSPKPPPLPQFNNPTPEQVFLAKNYDENSKKPDRDPRGAFRNPTDNPAAGIVGPLGSSSFNLPTVERALQEMEGAPASLNSSVSGDTARKSSRSTPRPPSASIPMPGAPSATSRSPAASPALQPPGGQSQHEVLHDFFQKLLDSKGRVAATPPRPSVGRSEGNGGEAEEGS